MDVGEDASTGAATNGVPDGCSAVTGTRICVSSGADSEVEADGGVGTYGCDDD